MKLLLSDEQLTALYFITFLFMVKMQHASKQAVSISLDKWVANADTQHSAGLTDKAGAED